MMEFKTLRRIALVASFCGFFFAADRMQAQAQTPAAASLTVKVTGIRNTTGNIRIVLRKDANTTVEARHVEIDAKTLTAQAVFENLPAGDYAVVAIHDENMNGKLDFDPNGMPLEGYGHSNNPAKRMGPPPFDETKFTVAPPGTTIEIKLIYWP